jgi:hypothetical protein
VIAMLAPVTDDYATTLARHLYQELAARPGLTVGRALANARRITEDERSRDAADRVPLPEGVGVARGLGLVGMTVSSMNWRAGDVAPQLVAAGLRWECLRGLRRALVGVT